MPITTAGTLAFRSPVVTQFLKGLGKPLRDNAERFSTYGPYGAAPRLGQLQRLNIPDGPDVESRLLGPETPQRPTDPWAPRVPISGDPNDDTARRQAEANNFPRNSFDERFGNWPKPQDGSWDEAGFMNPATNVPLPRPRPAMAMPAAANANAQPYPENIPWWIRNGFMQRDPESNNFLDPALARRAMGSFA